MKEANSIVLELQYLPCIQYFTKFLMYDKVLIEQSENYLKGSYRNRCHLASANGLIRLTIPLLKGKNEQQPIKDVQIAYFDSWPPNHWQTIQSAYGRAPFFEFYEEELKDLILSKPKNLFSFNLSMLNWILDQLGIEKKYDLTNHYQRNYTLPIADFRNCIFPKKSRQKKDDSFKPALYNQVFEEKNGFIPNLSILDLLFCTGPEARLILEKSIIFRPTPKA